jgi:hypothetical protein
MPDEREQMVKVPASALAALQARLEALEANQRTTTEALINPRARILDTAYEEWKAEASRPASERTQDVADKLYGKSLPRFKVWLDSRKEDGKPGPNIGEHFALEISAVDDVQAKGRYLQVMHISKHDYTLQAEPVGELAAV